MKRFKTPSSTRSEQNWGRILKDQNPAKGDQKKPTLGAVSSKPRIPANPSKVQAQPFSQAKSVQQIKNAKQAINKKASAKDLMEKLSSHTFRTDRKKQTSSSDSDLSLSAESVELVDRGVQYSTSNLDNFDPQNLEGIHNGGDTGLAFMNPVRTLNFLIRELRGKISESSQDDSLARIISDMESTATRISKNNGVKDNSGNIKDDLKCFLNILQRSEKDSDVDKGTQELQKKLEDTCGKLEEMCRVMEITANNKQKEEKQNLLSELTKTKESLAAAEKELRNFGKIDAELKEEKQKNDEAKRKIHEMKVKFSTLNTVLNEQLQEVKNENKRLHKEMKFLFLEKEKNSILMKVKDEEITKLRGSLEEIKDLVKEQLKSFQNDEIEMSLAEQDKGEKHVDMLNDMSSLITWSQDNLSRQALDLNKAVRCSSPVTSMSPAAEDDDSWRRISKVACDLHPVEEKTADIKESVKNLFEEMRKKSKLKLTNSAQQLAAADDPGKRWMEKLVDFEINSVKMHTLTDTDTDTLN